ncbi:aldehyde dehydrogenase family protein [Mycoplasma todarodis]|uniref:NADP-dependent glyceraldehyde-3-phosphate dehydrogenase n=1 Tax=Mycoplasma todarodis TaxID=1937191 RepID=A0A4R0XLB0_9MOLU|nr:aldehyde dehydrogenase family protein [Mycoplasma todarodis]TCG11254.1 NADP-dependent glyceraldehyde-3-phosphate dehydrogenase [Mycoplasma todarodis]
MESRAYINGEFVNGKKRYPIISPINLKEFSSAVALTKKEIDVAFAAARESQKLWKKYSREERIEFVSEFANKLSEKKEEIAEVMLYEIGKPLEDSIVEIQRTVELISETIYSYHNQLIEHVSGSTIGAQDKMITIIREPLGVVLAISPFNYPVNLALAKIIPAIISGNSVVFKPATNGSLTAYLIAQIFDEIKLPKGVFNLVTGKGSEIGDYLTQHKEPDAITYTGSTKIGLAISKNSMLQSVILEMGGKDAALLLEDVVVSEVVSGIIKGAFSFSGQRCTAIKRVFVPKAIKKEFELEMKRAVAEIPIGDPVVNKVVVGPVIDLRTAKFQKKLIDDATTKGAKILIGGKINKNMVEPTVLVNVTPEMKIAKEEQFGPVLPIIYYTSLEEAIEEINDSEYGLQASIYTRDYEKALKISEEIEVGSVNINCPPSRGPDQLPFTGVKHSGFGVQGIKYSIESMTRPKNLVIFKKKNSSLFKKKK